MIALGSPLALWLLLLLPIPLLLSRRRAARRHDVANLYLWRTTTDSDAPAIRVRPPRRQWLVLLQMAVIAGIVFALARPSVAVRGERIALVFDVSASMRARDGTGTRFDAARARARAVVASLARRTRVRILAAGAAARDLGEYAASDAALTAQIDRLQPAFGHADVAGAVLLATRSSPVDRIVIVSDHVSDIGRPAAAVSWETVGHSADNLAISALAARRRQRAPQTADLLVTVRNYGAPRSSADIEIAQDGTPVARRSIDIGPDGVGSILMTLPHAGRTISARVRADDALPIDDERRDVVAPFEPVRVRLEGARNFYVEKALAANASVAVVGAGEAADVIVCGCDRLPPAGNVLRIPDRVPVSSGAALTVVAPLHPLATDVPLADTIVSPAAGVVDGDVVVRAGGAPAIVASDRDGRRVVDFRFPPAPEAAIGAAFPILVANAVRWLDGRQDNPTAVVAGEPLRWIVPEPAGGTEVVGPDGRTRPAQISGRTMTVADTTLPGIYVVRTARGEREFASNPAVADESDLRTPAAPPPTAAPAIRSTTAFALTRPLLFVAALLVGVEWFITRRRTAWHVAIASSLVLAAAGLALLPRPSPLDIVALVDRSRSVPSRTQQQTLQHIAAAAASLRRGDRLAVVDFGAEALVRSEFADVVSAAANTSAIADGETDIAGGLRVARAMLAAPASGRIVLFSDGRQTVGDADRQAALLSADGVRVDVSPIDASASAAQSMRTHVHAPAYARSGEPFGIGVDVEGAPDTDAELTFYRDERAAAARAVRLDRAGRASVIFDERQAAGVHVYRALVKSDDAEAESGAVVTVSGPATVLYVARSAGALTPALVRAGFDVARVVPENVPRGVEALQRYDTIVLDDVSADEIGDERLRDIARDVEQRGSGLLLLGGSSTLDLAGYPSGPLAASLPIDFRARPGQRAPSFGLVVVFDKSGSMADQDGGSSKIERARQAVMRVLDVLPPSDPLGVIAFDAQPVAVAALGPGHAAPELAARLQAIAPGGATRIAPAVAMAARWLAEPRLASTLSKRRILLMSDGQTTPDDEQALRAAVAAARGIEVSAVAVGTTANHALLEQLAGATGGRAYFPADLGELSKIVSREASRSRGGQIVEEPFALRGLPHPILTGIDPASLPMARGYVVGAARPGAASVLASHLGDPILAAWPFGLGRVAVFTADLTSPWSAPLRAWPGFGRLWVQAARWLSRTVDDRELRLTSAPDGDALRLTIDAEDAEGAPLDLIGARATIRSPDGRTSETSFDTPAPGRFAARIHAPATGAYTLVFSGRDREGRERHLSAGVYRNDDAEEAVEGSGVELLRRLAATTGGRVLPPSGDPFDAPRPITYRDVSSWVAVAALVMYVTGMLFGLRLPHPLHRLLVL